MLQCWTIVLYSWQEREHMGEQLIEGNMEQTAGLSGHMEKEHMRTRSLLFFAVVLLASVADGCKEMPMGESL